jgi:DNA-binding transcriptional ArsR family regulator
MAAKIEISEVESEDERLDRVFSALSDPVRRSILARLEIEPCLVSELAEPFEMSLQAVSRHIQVLTEAGLIQKERTGRISRCSLDAGPMMSVAAWINRYSKYWQEQFELMASALEPEDADSGATASQGRAEPAPTRKKRARPSKSTTRHKPTTARATKRRR